ncbi:MAG: hypothetical protein AABZ80_05625 [Gemmatimonadota bacterium]
MISRRREGVGTLLLGAVLVVLLSCDLSVAPGGFYSISKLLLPSPGVVLGDTMRDSTGKAAPLRLLAFSASGSSVSVTPYFITLDTFAHLSGGTTLIGDRVGLARVIGGVANVQTLPETVKVTLSPDTMVAADSVRHVKRYSVLTDTLANSAELAALVQHRVGGVTSGVDAVIVKYSIVSAPPSRDTGATVALMNGNAVSKADTTTNGRAARSLRLRINQLTTVNPDSAVIRATASYRGVSIGTVQFTVVFTSQ